MFVAGDYVVYGQSGICQVMDITTMEMDGVPKDRLYYVLRPDGKTEGRIFAPVENGRLVIRRMMTRDEAEQLIREIPEIEALSISNDKLREEKYKECIKSCESREMVRIIKTIYFRKLERSSRGKKVTATDERYLKIAEDNLYSELSMLLDVPKNQMESYLNERVKEQV
ncbi:MAG: CarD family transcriptional regulator [Clostridiales bacterium]|nr:CarD family transcriptional regulator [Candidatus Blautia equi]